MHRYGSVSRLRRSANVVQDVISSVPSSFTVTLQLNRNVLPILFYSGMPICTSGKLLLSMITDDRQHVHELRIRGILKACSSTRASAVGQFKVPEPSLDAHEVDDLIDWQNSHITEPPLTFDISEEHLRLFVTSGEALIANFPNLPCHSSFTRGFIIALLQWD